MIADIIIAAVILLFAAIGIKRGIARTLLGVLGMFATAALTYYLSDFFAGLVYDSFIKETVAGNINGFIAQNGIDYAASNCLGALPDWLYGIVSFAVSVFGVSIEQFQSDMDIITGEAADSASAAIEQAVGSVAVSVFRAFFAIILFILIYILIRKLVRFALRAFELPVIRHANRFLGGILGTAEGIIVVWIAVNIFYAVMLLASPGVLSDELVCGRLFRLFCIQV